MKAYSQCFIIKTTLSDCSICRSRINELEPSVTNIPVYVIFPEDKRVDSSDIEYVGNFSKSGFNLIFNDLWYDSLKSIDNTTIYAVDKFGNVTNALSLSSLTSNTINDILKGFSSKIDEGNLFYYIDSNEFKFDMQLGNLYVLNRFTGKMIYSIRSSKINSKLISSHLIGEQKIKFDKFSNKITKLFSGFNTVFTSFSICKDSSIYMLLKYHSTPDSISPNISDEFCIFHYKDSSLLDVIPINLSKDVILYDPIFKLDSNNNLLFYSYTISNNGYDLSTCYVANFVRDDNHFNFSHYYEFPMPSINRFKYKYNDLSLLHSQFPYVSNYLSNTILNLKTNTTAFIVPDSTYQRGMTNTIDIDSEKLHVFFIRRLSINRLSVAYQYKNTMYANLYDDSLKLLQVIRIPFLFSRSSYVAWMEQFPSIGLLKILYRGSTDREYFIPLSLIFQDFHYQNTRFH